jgi:signal transduction histidine kinase
MAKQVEQPVTLPKQWFAIYTKPRWEKKIDAVLIRKGVNSWGPIQKTERFWSDRKKIIDEPLFRSYVFVQIDATERATVLSTPGVLNFVYYVGKPAIIRDEEIEIIKNTDEVYIEVNESSLTRILNNIIDNAVSYSNKIIITIVKEEKKYLTILVDDDGIGIPKEKYSEVFKPFFRLNNARTMENKNLNVGLGLAIVKDLVIQIGGKIELDKSPLQGLRVKIDLPV